MSIDIDGGACVRSFVPVLTNNGFSISNMDQVSNPDLLYAGADAGLCDFVVSGDNNEIMTITKQTPGASPAITAYVEIALRAGFVNTEVVMLRVNVDSVASGTISNFAVINVGAAQDFIGAVVPGDKIVLQKPTTNPLSSGNIRIGFNAVGGGDDTTNDSVSFSLVQVSIGDVGSDPSADEIYQTGNFLSSVNPLYVEGPIAIGAIATTANAVAPDPGKANKILLSEAKGLACSPTNERNGVAWLGDSFTAGPDNLVYPGFQKLGGTSNRWAGIVADCKGGRTAEQGIPKVSPLLATKATSVNADTSYPWVVAVHLGINDFSGGGKSAAQVQSYIEDIRDNANANGAYVVFNDSSPYKGWTGGAWPGAAEQLAFRTWAAGLTYADDGMMAIQEYDALVNLGGGGVADTILTAYRQTGPEDFLHINEAGYAVLRPLYITAFEALPTERATARGATTLTTPFPIGTNNGPMFSATSSDSIATVEAAGFFTGNAGWASLLKTGDVLLLEMSNGTKLYTVTVNKQARTIALSTGLTIT